MLAAFKIADDVVACCVRQLLRRQREMHANLALHEELSDQLGIFRRDGSGRNTCWRAISRMRQAVIGIAHGADERSNGAEFSCGFGTGPAIAYGFAIGDERESRGGFLFVKELIEKNNL